MTTSDPYISTDSHGVIRVAGTRISLDSVIIGFRQGDSPEEIHRHFPSLTLEQVYGVITHYLSNRQAVEDYLHRQKSRYEHLRAQHEESEHSTVERLRALRAKASRRAG